MGIAEGRTLSFVGPEHIDVAVLETFDYDGPEQEIATETGEFTAVCPYSGLPDFARLTITYVPGKKCVELKSLKYYVTSFRNVGIFQEHATARIAEDLDARFGALFRRIDEPARFAVLDLRDDSPDAPGDGRPRLPERLRDGQAEALLDRFLHHRRRVDLEGVDLHGADVVEVGEDVDVRIAGSVGDGLVVAKAPSRRSTSARSGPAKTTSA